MERPHMNYQRGLIHRLRADQFERGISRDLRISRMPVLRHHELAERQGSLQPGSALPDAEAVQSCPCRRFPRPPSPISGG